MKRGFQVPKSVFKVFMHMDTVTSLAFPKKAQDTASWKKQGRIHTAQKYKKRLFLFGAADIVDSTKDSNNQPQWQRKSGKFRDGNIVFFFNNDVIEKYAI